ncbi:hypothetical protein R1sor_020381 [Riccia sorocarpa]|uniref:Reverse transcriptase zinc-binding domain-containing protein n=1 Tax=Riccia sorocarpa TaxID=122646 RepID=A0ABD3IIK0_9MARC
MRDQAERNEPCRDLGEELKEVRNRIARDNSVDNRDRLRYLEKIQKEKEIHDAKVWRLRSRARWMREGDAPWQYFFAMLKSKYKREAIESLVKDDGALITEHDEILRETQVFYQNLFREEETSIDGDWEEETSANLRLLTSQVCPEQRGFIERVPDMEELERTVDLLPPEKFPGLDGVTSEAAEEAEWRKAEEVIRRIATEGEFWSYLGCPLGVNLSEEQVMQSMLDRMTKRLSHWTGRLLSWESRIVLTRHILMAIPTYSLMALGLTKDEYRELMKVCRRFVWGVNKEGYDKKVLIAWHKICRRREDGGLGLISFDLQAKALKLKLITKVLNGDCLDWIFLLRAIVEWKILDIKCRQQETGNSLEETLLLGAKLNMRETPTAARILEGWWEVRRFLFSKTSTPIPGDVSISSAVKIALGTGPKETKEWKRCRGLLKRLSINSLEEATEYKLREMAKLDVNGGRRRGGEDASGPVSQTTATIIDRFSNIGVGDNTIATPAIWFWEREGKTKEGWNLRTADWRSLLEPPRPEVSKLNVKWEVDLSVARWKKWWEDLWNTNLFLPDKVWFWRLILQGIMVNQRLMKMGIGDGVCERCRRDVESVAHCVFYCGRVKTRWLRLMELLTKVQPEAIPHDGTLTAVKRQLQLQMILQEASLIGRELAVVATSKRKVEDANMANTIMCLMEKLDLREKLEQNFNIRRLHLSEVSQISPPPSEDTGRTLSYGEDNQSFATNVTTEDEEERWRTHNPRINETLELAEQDLARLGFVTRDSPFSF